VMESFKEYEEIESASPNAAFKPAASTGQWYLDQIGIDELREGGGPPLGQIARRVHSSPYGSNSIGVALFDFHVNCDSPLLAGHCVRPNNRPDACPKELFEGIPSKHGTRSAALIAGKSPSRDEVAEGVAWETNLFPLKSRGEWSFHQAVDCILALKGAGSNIQILNVSGNIPDGATARASVCNAVCNNLLLVASAGNDACPPSGPSHYPASYNEDLGCPCMGGNLETSQTRTSNRILKVGGVDSEGRRGRSCSSENKMTQEGEIWAPGWGIPAPLGPLPNGTSSSAALVSGCAAVYGAYQLGNAPWNATIIHYGLLRKAKLVGNKKLLNCSAVSEP